MSEIRRFQGIAHYETTRSNNASTLAVPYLRRNLRRALDHQQYDLLLERGHDPAEIPGDIRDNYDDEFNADWDFPRDTMLSDIIRGLEPTICCDGLVLRHKDSARVKASHKTRPGRAGSPDWLPAENEWKVPCQVSIRLLYQTDPKRLIHHDMRDGHIVRHDHATKDPAFEIVLDSAFKIPLGRFDVMVDYKDSNGNTRWKLARDDDKVLLDFRIRCNDSADSAHLLSQLERRDISDYLSTSPDESEMRITWKGLPNLPPSGTLLELNRSQRRKSKVMHYKADVKAVWSQECSPLVAWNRAWQLQQQEAARQLPTPSVSDDFERPRKMRVQYLTRRTSFQAKSATERGLHCVVSSCHDRAEHSSLERLMLHYAIHHDHMKFEINAERSDDNLAVIFISAAEDVAGSISREFEWEAPRSAFDIRAHLDGTKPWSVTHVRGKDKPVKSTPQKSPKKRAPAGQSLPIPISLGRPKPVIRRPEDVPDLPTVPRKTHKVPVVENISFYRTLSKQQVTGGDEISDSEAEADMEWAVQAQRREQTLMGIDLVTQEFNEALNKHLDREQPMSHIYTEHAVVRFARENIARLSQQWRELFREKLEQFEDKRIISRDTVTYCMGLLTAEPTQGEVAGSGQALGRNRISNRRDTESGTRTPERRGTRSPSQSQMSTKSRLRWSQGKMSQQESVPAINGAHRSALGSPTPRPASQSREDIPFGRRRVMCRRGSKNSGPHHIYDFVRDDRQDVPHKELRPSELELAKLLRILDDDLNLSSDVDAIVCISSNGKARPIVDEDDWMSALKDIEINAPPGDVVFQLRPQHALEEEEGSTTEKATGKRKKHNEDNLAGPARKKVRIQEAPLCVCGEKAEGVRGTMMCGNSRCEGKFHLRCLGLERRPVDEWLCEKCR